MNLADKMRINIKIHQSTFKGKQKKYIKELFKKIERVSKQGRHYIQTYNLHCELDWFTYDFYKSIPQIFKNEGFKVEEDSSSYGLITHWWVISW